MKQETIAYKVIGKKLRYGTNMTCFLTENNLTTERLFTKWKNENPAEWKRIQAYYPKYEKDVIIQVPKTTKGILCFDSFQRAEKFRQIFSELGELKMSDSLFKTIKVCGFGPKKKLRTLTRMSIYSELDTFLWKKDSVSCPTGTISFQKIKVLE